MRVTICKFKCNFETNVSRTQRKNIAFGYGLRREREKVGSFGPGSMFAAIGEFVRDTDPDVKTVEGLRFYNEEGDFIDAIYTTDYGFAWFVENRSKSNLPN